MDTGFDVIDGATADAIDRLINIVMGATSSGGQFTEGETVHVLSSAGVTGATLTAISWAGSTTGVMEANLVAGSIEGVSSAIGDSSGASYSIASIGFTADFFAKDAMEDNTELMFEGSSFLDFTDKDPFSEGDI